MSTDKLDFHDTKKAFQDYSDSELKEKYRLFRLMNSPTLNNFGTRTTEIALGLGLPVSWLLRFTIFDQFCGGETISDCQDTIDRLASSKIGTILDYSVEGKALEADFEGTKEEVIRNLQRAKNDDDIPFAVFKLTGIAPVGTLEKVSCGADLLTDSNKIKWRNAKRRVEEICEFAFSIEQSVFIDAEESWIQPAIDSLASSMMKKYNKKDPIVYNTIQLYRKDRLDFLKKSHQEARNDGYIYGAKLVRGAYMEKERERAEEMGYESPIHDDKASTDRDFDLALEYCIENFENLALVAATHNESSVQKLIKAMAEKNMSRNDPKVYFSQLYGMSDNITHILAADKFNTTKYVPYGPIKDAVPYLIRRARENSSVMGQMSRELDLLSSELKRRNLT